MADQLIHGNVLVHKKTKRVYHIIHPRVQGPDRIIRIGVIDTTTGMLMYIYESAFSDFDEYTKAEWNSRKYDPYKMPKVNPFMPTPSKHVHYIPNLSDGKRPSSTQPAPINEYYTRVGQKEAAKLHILKIVRILETHVYEHLYYETWLDRYYQRYCIKRGRDIPREERIEDEEHTFVAPGEIYRYLKENIPLDELKILKDEINADHELQDIYKDNMDND